MHDTEQEAAMRRNEAQVSARLEAELTAALADLTPRLRRLLGGGWGELLITVHDGRVTQLATTELCKRKATY